MRIKDSKSFLFQYKREQIYWPGLLENTCSLGKYSAGFYLPLFVENKRRFRSLFPRLPSQASLPSPAEHLGKMKWVAEVHDNENQKTGGRAIRTTFYVLSSLFQFIGSDNVSTLSALTLVLHALLVYVATSKTAFGGLISYMKCSTNILNGF